MSKKIEFLAKVKSNTLKGEDLLLLLEVMEEIALENEDVQDLLLDLKEADEIIKLNFNIGRFKAALIIENAILKTQRGLISDPVITIAMDEPTALEILKGKLSMQKAYAEGLIKAEGALIRAAALGILLNIVGDELGVL
jgi:hypothetical protein